MIDVKEFGLRIPSAYLTPSHRSYRPPSWPPPRDWVLSEDRDGNVVSQWGNPVWDLSPWVGKAIRLDFIGGRRINGRERLDADNADLMRLLTTWRIWGPRAVTAATTVLTQFFNPIRRIISLCSQNGVLASDLMRFPRVLDQIPGVITASSFQQTIVELHRLWDARQQIGFCLVDEQGLKRLLEIGPKGEHEPKQTPYIPPRIWAYQVQRLRECLDDFLAHEEKVRACFEFCLDAYVRNYGSLKGALLHDRIKSKNPFQSFEERSSRTGGLYLGPFEPVAQRFGIRDLLKRWFKSPARGLGVPQFAGYLTMVQYAAIAYIANFTLQRIREAASLRADCLMWEMDPKFGRVPIICGETTKTDPDSDARWPTSPSVEGAISVAASIARLRVRCAAANDAVRPTQDDQQNPYLFGRAFEPWGGGTEDWSYSILPTPIGYGNVVQLYPLLFDTERLRISAEDLKIAQMLTPSLTADERFAVGRVWPLAWHQLRRTGAVNMFASGLLSDSSIQLLLKHSSRLMSLYYGRGYAKLHVNEDVERAVVEAMYETMAHKLQAAMSDRFVSPLGPERKQAILVNLIGQKDFRTLVAAGRRGQTSFRENRLGCCTKRGTCSYGGIESVARCAGADGARACADALFDRSKAPDVEKDLERLNRHLARVPTDSPAHKALLAERKGLENFLNVVRT